MILNADARQIPLTDQSVHMVCTSPPFWGLRDYGVVGQLGLERTPEDYVAALVAVFREVWRVLRDDGTCWLNLGDSYTSAGGGGEARMVELGRPSQGDFRAGAVEHGRSGKRPYAVAGLKPKDLVGVPWRVAFALQADGWYLRSDIIWSKPNPMPESVTDRPTKAHEYLFLLSKRATYYYDAEAIKEKDSGLPSGNGMTGRQGGTSSYHVKSGGGGTPERWMPGGGRNRRTVWEIATQPYAAAHFATFPEALVEPCVLAGTSERGCCSACGAPWGRVVERAGYKFNGTITPKGEAREDAGLQSAKTGLHEPGWRDQARPATTTGWQPTCACGFLMGGERTPRYPLTTQPLVLDPFAGSGTVGQVCQRLGRRFVGLELKPDYCALANKRTAQLGLI